MSRLNYLVVALLCIAGCPSIRVRAQSAGMEGSWTGTARASTGIKSIRISLKKEAQGYSGQISGLQEESSLPLLSLEVTDDTLRGRVEIVTAEGTAVVVLNLVRQEQGLTGRGEWSSGARTETVEFELVRVTDAAAAPAAPERRAEDAEAVDLIREEQDRTTRRRMIEEFVKKFPQSAAIGYVHQEGAYLAQQDNDYAEMVEHGEKSLEILPDNYALMTALANAYAEKKEVAKAEDKAERAIVLALNAAKPAAVSEEQWNAARDTILATNYSTIGFVHLRRAQDSEDAAQKKAEVELAVPSFKKAIELQKTDDISLWRLGISYVFLNDYANAESNLAKAVVLNGVASSNARNTLEAIFRQAHNNTLQGLDAVLEKARRDLSLP